MKLAIIGSRNLNLYNVGDYLPADVSEIVSGGARGIDSAAADYARRNAIPLTEFLPDYARYGRAAPLKRNEKIAQYADEALAFWDGTSRGTAYAINLFHKLGKRVTVIEMKA